MEAAINLATHAHSSKSADCDGWEGVIDGLCGGVGAQEGIITKPDMKRFEEMCGGDDGFIDRSEQDLYYEWHEVLLEGETKVAWVSIGVTNRDERRVDEENPYIDMDEEPPGRRFFLTYNAVSAYEHYLEHRSPEERANFEEFKVSAGGLSVFSLSTASCC